MAQTPPAASTALAAGERSSRILLNASFRAIADIGSKVATAALYLFVARKTGASQFGILVFAMAFAGVAVTLGQFGQEIVLTREVARDNSRLDEYYSGVLLSRVLLSVPPLLIALAAVSLGGMSAETRVVILLMGFGFIGDFLIQVSFAVFQAHERVGLLPVVLITQRWATTIAAVIALYNGAGIVTVAALYCSGALLAALFAAWLMYRRLARPRLRLDLSGALRVTREAVPVGLGTVAFVLLVRVDTLMLAIFEPSSVVGQYGAAYRLLETTAFVTWSVNTAVLPAMAQLSPTSVPPLGAVYERALKLLLAITLPMATVAAILSGPIIALLYGPQYHAAASALTLLAATIMLFPVSSLSSQLLYSQNVRRVVAATYGAVFLENVVFNLIAIPQLSLNGAAIGTSTSELLVAATLIFFSRSLHGHLNLRRILSGPTLGSCAVAAVAVLLHQHLGLAVGLAIITYLLVFLGHERLAFPEDFDVIRHFAVRITPVRGAAAPP